MKLPSGTTTTSGHFGQSRNVDPGLLTALSEKATADKAQQSAPAPNIVEIQGDNSGFMI
jgi:hypothetical protein